MSRRPWIGVSLSVALHAVAFALVVVSFSPDDWLPALVVDLREEFRSGPTTSVRAPAGESSGTRSSTPAPRRSRLAKRDTSRATPEAPEATAPPAPAPMPTMIADTPLPAATPSPATEAARESPAPAAPPRESPPARSFAGAAPGEAASPVGGEGRARSEPEGGMTGSSSVVRGSSGTLGDHGSGGGPGGRSGQALALAAPGTGSGVGAEYGPYLTALRQRIQQSVRYPASARRRGIGGTVNVEILILPSGAVGDIRLLESSSHSVLDDAALDTIRSLPRMPLPPDLPARALRVRVPVVFQLQ